MGYRVDIDQNKCTGCSRCVMMCPRRILDIKDGKAYATEPESCDGLAGCIRKCPSDSITIQPTA